MLGSVFYVLSYSFFGYFMIILKYSWKMSFVIKMLIFLWFYLFDKDVMISYFVYKFLEIIMLFYVFINYFSKEEKKEFFYLSFMLFYIL